MTKPENILIVDDEKTIREVLRRYLEKEGFQVEEAADGYQVLDALERKSPDLMVLDLMLPGIDGLSLTQLIRRDRRIPIIMLTAKGEASDRIRGLDMGADDYIAKPFSPQEVVSRIRAVLRRTSDEHETRPAKTILIDHLLIDPAGRTVQVDGQPTSLTAKEFDLLLFFARHPMQVYSRTQLLGEVWGDELYTDPSTVTVHIRRLREKIERDPGEPELIRTVWGVGYKFVGESP
jgi:DNA-binding response OmpR family regulator